MVIFYPRPHIQDMFCSPRKYVETVQGHGVMFNLLLVLFNEDRYNKSFKLIRNIEQLPFVTIFCCVHLK
jgi:hypothetical protein